MCCAESDRSRSYLLPLLPTTDHAIFGDITFEETNLSADGTSLSTRLTITDHGNGAITLYDNDITLTVEGQLGQERLQVIPTLTQQLQPGASLSLVV